MQQLDSLVQQQQQVLWIKSTWDGVQVNCRWDTAALYVDVCACYKLVIDSLWYNCGQLVQFVYGLLNRLADF